MIVKTEEDPLKEADIWLRTWLTMWSWRCGTTRSISFLHFFKFKVSSKRSPGSRLLIVNSLSKHLAHPFLLPAAHKIVNCLGKQAMGNLGVERHKSQRENYGTLLYHVHGQMGSTKYLKTIQHWIYLKGVSRDWYDPAMVCASNILFVKSVYMTRIILEVSSDDIVILGMVNMVIQAQGRDYWLSIMWANNSQTPSRGFGMYWKLLKLDVGWTRILNLVLATS